MVRLKKRGLSYNKIKDHYLKTKGERITIRGVELAIERYLQEINNII